VLDQSIVLTDATGSKHTWTKAATGGYTPPAGEDGILGLDTTGKVTLTEGASVYVFNTDGTLATQSSSVDSKKPAALQNIYSGTPSRLTQIKDPVSGRAHTLYYNTNGTNSCYGGATPPPGTDTTAPAQMLCRIAYWDGTETRIWYSGQTVARIENPGSDDQDYGYTSTTGPLIAVRSSLVNDWIAVDPTNRASRTDILTVLSQDTSSGKPKATNVTLPVPDGGTTTPRPAHSYRYDPANRQSFVDVAGLSPASGFFTKVTYDDADRELTTTDATNKTASKTWNTKDQVLTSNQHRGPGVDGRV
jgi:YD repeat-containing protein